MLLWPEKVEPGLTQPEPSVAHTARAVVALRGVMHNHGRDEIRVAVENAIEWLVDWNHPDDGVTEELIRPKPEGGTTRVIIRHFTSALVVQALSGVPHMTPQWPPWPAAFDLCEDVASALPPAPIDVRHLTEAAWHVTPLDDRGSCDRWTTVPTAEVDLDGLGRNALFGRVREVSLAVDAGQSEWSVP